MSNKKVLTREEYAEKFNTLFSNMNYIMQEGEKIVQCKVGYPDYWFISNKGYLFSAYGKKLKVIKPIFDKTGKANKKGNRAGKTWRYTTRYKTKNSQLNRYEMSRIIADHFSENEFTGYENERTDIHHIQKQSTFGQNEPQKCNNSDNLQTLPVSIHKRLTHYASKTSDELDKELFDKVEKANCPIFQFTEKSLEAFLLQAVRSCLAQEKTPIMYETSLTNDVSQIKAEAHPIKNVTVSDERNEY